MSYKTSMTGPYDVTIILDGEKMQFEKIERIDFDGGVVYFVDSENKEHCYFGNIEMYFTKSL